ncbi:MAG: type II toxin-antitoxin system RelE/ParE family toxin [Sulfurospirillum sp.]|nr:type II toxin-antitoxin system RelE/ParE family toxin [Sulfurospirillum sp.]
MPSVIFSKKATEALINQAQYIFEQTQNIEISDIYLDDMQKFIVLILRSFPESGRPTDEILKGSRKIVYKGYSIIYQIGDRRIEVLTIYRENLSK